MTGPSHHWWNDERARGVVYQTLLLGVIALFAWFLVSNTLANLHDRHIATGFGFLSREAAFGISEHLIDYAPTSSYGRAFVVGLLNTLEVTAIGIVLATLLGVFAGIARLSSNWMIARVATVYVETVRNIPLLLQLFFWYQLLTEALPSARQALSLGNVVFLSNRGLKLPTPVWNDGLVFSLAGLAIAIGAILVLARVSTRRRTLTGRGLPVPWIGLGLVVVLPSIGLLLSGGRLEIDVPHLAGFNFAGGTTISPEFSALLVGLVVYTAGFIAEIVRAGILAVPRGQTEAALSLGLSRGQVLRLVVLPQSLRVIVPPLTSQYLNILKNSPLAVAIGYPDLVAVGNTTINQTGQAVEAVSLTMGVYLFISLMLSAGMNMYNARIARRGGR